VSLIQKQFSQNVRRPHARHAALTRGTVAGEIAGWLD